MHFVAALDESGGEALGEASRSVHVWRKGVATDDDAQTVGTIVSAHGRRGPSLEISAGQCFAAALLILPSDAFAMHSCGIPVYGSETPSGEVSCGQAHRWITYFCTVCISALDFFVRGEHA
jgi:hypothetical protein